MEEYIKEISNTIIRLDLGLRFIPMEIFILETLNIIKDRVRGHFIGSISLKISIIMREGMKNILANGGAECLMERASMKELMVTYKLIAGDFY